MKTVNAVIKTKIWGYFKKHKLDDLYLEDFANEVGYRSAKYSDLEILNYLCDAFVDAIENKNQTDNTIQKLVLSIYGIFAQLVFEKKVIRQDIYNKVLSTEGKYNKYFDENKLSNNEIVTKFIDNINNLINKSNKVEVDMKDVDAEGKVKKTNEESKVSSNEEKVKKQDDTLKAEIKELESQIKKLTKEVEKYKNKTEEKKEKIKELNKSIKELNEKIKELEKEIKTKEKENIELNEQIEKLTKKFEELNDVINKLNNENKENKARISEILLSDEYACGKKSLENEKIDDDVLKLIFLKECSIYEIHEKYPNYSYDQIQESLVRISEKYKIEPQDISIPKRFKVQKIWPDMQKKLRLKGNTSHYLDVMFISDLHIDDENLNDVSRRLDKVYDYCTRRGINTLINLGDFIDQEFRDLNNYEENKAGIRLLDNIVEELPTSPTINHVILGGNHDDRFLYLGINPLKYVSTRRDDIINLGYYDALIELYCKEANDYILLHHKGVPSENYNYQDAEQVLKSYSYSIRPKETKGNPYIQMFGHLHRARIDAQKEYAIVPSLMKGEEYTSGALQAKIYFDLNGNISNILFIPLSYDNGLKKVAEIPYTKVKKK